MVKVSLWRRCSEGLAQSTTFECGVGGFWMPPAWFLEGTIETLLSKSCLLALLIARGCLVIGTSMQAFVWPWVATWDAIV